mmetsp:Transcript_8046/g.25719  ORF Transcript_8046/g.25719 Transcript_8046/m.25719 type:complete len:258 (+) Transcript_8046:2848-3621(+)
MDASVVSTGSRCDVPAGNLPCRPTMPISPRKSSGPAYPRTVPEPCDETLSDEYDSRTGTGPVSPSRRTWPSRTRSRCTGAAPSVRMITAPALKVRVFDADSSSSRYARSNANGLDESADAASRAGCVGCAASRSSHDRIACEMRNSADDASSGVPKPIEYLASSLTDRWTVRPITSAQSRPTSWYTRRKRERDDPPSNVTQRCDTTRVPEWPLHDAVNQPMAHSVGRKPKQNRRRRDTRARSGSSDSMDRSSDASDE